MPFCSLVYYSSLSVNTLRMPCERWKKSSRSDSDEAFQSDCIFDFVVGGRGVILINNKRNAWDDEEPEVEEWLESRYYNLADLIIPEALDKKNKEPLIPCLRMEEYWAKIALEKN